jgi:membrane protein
MKQTEQPLYPKLSSIYNKILQLAIAIIFIVVLMNVWVLSREAHHVTIDEHARKVGNIYLSQAATITAMQIDKDRQSLQRYANELAAEPLVKDVHIYDATGNSLVRSNDALSMNELFGIAPQKLNKTADILPFVKEIRDEKVSGYIRLSLYRSPLVEGLTASSQQQYDMMRFMMILAGVVGFLLTRGLNRFSRQGYRVAKSDK